VTAFSAERRRLLKAALGIAPAAVLLAASGCAPEAAPPPAEALRIPLAQLPEGERVRLLMGDRPIEVVRTGSAVRARSLWCTHMGCEVTWNGDRSRYLCPCHDGEFDSEGVPVGGPPKRPLRRLESIVEGEAVLVRMPVVPS
jgi:nitrite reductase/ring-hydroxylating ferredoxin subunit